MGNLKSWFFEAAAGEEILAVVIGGSDADRDFLGPDDPTVRSGIPRGVLLSWEHAVPWLDYEFDAGFGLPGCFPVYAWTATRILAVTEYDGATGVISFPRNPTAGLPHWS